MNKLVISTGSLSSCFYKNENDCLFLKAIAEKYVGLGNPSKVLCSGIDSKNLAKKIKIAKKKLSLKKASVKLSSSMEEEINLEKVALTAGIIVRRPKFSFKAAALNR